MNSSDASLEIETDTPAIADDPATGALPSLSRLSLPAGPARVGKIARLPQWLRDELHEKMRDGVPGKELVMWLNGLPEVRAVLRKHFEGKEITEQNLSSWRQGGYLDWLAHHERREWLEQMQEESGDLQRDAGAQPIMETFGTMMEMVLGLAVQDLMRRRVDVSDPQQLKQLLEVSREVARHRRLSQGMMKERELKLHRKKQLRVALGRNQWDQVDEWEEEDEEKMYGSDEEEEEEVSEEDEEEEVLDETEADPGESRQIAADFKTGGERKAVMTSVQEEELRASLVGRLQARLQGELEEAGMTEADMAELMKMVRGKAEE